ncbi:MAG: alpha/beta hydrolase, partial [Rhodanobacteraceae bacterium]
AGMDKLLGLLVVMMCASLTGCAGFVARNIEQPGHIRTAPQMRQLLGELGHYRQHQFHAPAGVRIAYWYATPSLPGITGNLQLAWRNGKLAKFSFTDAQRTKAKPAPPTRGSVVLLPPWGQNAAQMMFWGLPFSAAGYVTVMADLRSQGDSGNAPVGYGPREAGDIVALIRQLQDEHRLPAPLYLFGVSYGATVALFAAPDLPKLRGVIALEPYVHPVDVIERAPASGLLGPKWWAYFLGPSVMDKGIARADKKLGIDLASIDPADALAKSRACTLLLRGSDDKLISGRALADLSQRSNRARYVEIPGANHVTLFFGHGIHFGSIVAWMQRIPDDADAACPDYVPEAVSHKTRATH